MQHIDRQRYRLPIDLRRAQLQVSRIGREDGFDVTIFIDQDKADAWLEAQSSLRPPW
jgi:hypothetical protein